MDERAAAITETMADIRTIAEAEGGDGIDVTRATVEAIRDRLLELAANRHLFSLDLYPPPQGPNSARSCLHRLSQDPDDRFTLYAQTSRGAIRTPVHNHTTWAVVVGFEGRELNRFYRRTDDGVVETHQHMVEAGTGVAMVGDDLHSIHIDAPALNFHCYGLALERLDDRVLFDAKSGEWRPFPGSPNIREARPGVVR